MQNSFPSRDTLCAMSAERLRLVDVADRDEELLVQEILDSKLSVVPATSKVYTGDVPDIKTPEQEKEWQAKLDERAAKIRERRAIQPKEATVAPELAPEPLELPTVAPDTQEEPKNDTPIIDPDKPKRFCDLCDSRGGIHKKGCPKKTK